jgi:biopolymer transport protein ExbD
MAIKIEQGEDTTMNMTPMIDVCFQLIVFFMLTLKFPSISSRFESMLPKDRGQAASPATLTPLQEITVKLFRKDVELDKLQHFTRIRVGETLTVNLPRGPWKMDAKSEDERRAVEDKEFAKITEAIGAAFALQQRNPEVKGEIKTPPPTGQLVPHGDVMRVLDSFVAAGVVNVNFEGAPAPVPSKEGGGWNGFNDPPK